MVKRELDTHRAGLLGIIFNSFCQLGFSRDREWKAVLNDEKESRKLQSVGASASRASIWCHSWIFFEYAVDVLAPKVEYRFDSSTRNAHKKKDKRKNKSRAKYDDEEIRDENLQVVLGPREDSTQPQRPDYKGPILMVYGKNRVFIRSGSGFDTDVETIWQHLALSTLICFALFAWGFAYISTLAASLVFGISWLLTFMTFFGVFWKPAAYDVLFDKCIGNDADTIHAAGNRYREAKQSKHETIDVLLVRGENWTWCRIGDTWMSVMVPFTERPVSLYTLQALNLISHTVLPGGWMNETNMHQNLPFALLTALIAYNRPGYSFGGVILGTVLNWLNLQKKKTGDWWILAWYFWIAGLLAGKQADFMPLVTYISGSWPFSGFVSGKV